MPKMGMEPIRRQQIIGSVLKCIAEKGVGSITQEMVAKTADVSKGVVTYYFENKEIMIEQSFITFLESYLSFPDDSVVEIEYGVKDVLRWIGMVSLGLGGEEYPLLAEAQFGLSTEQKNVIITQMYGMLSVNHHYKEKVAKVYKKYLDSIMSVFGEHKENAIKIYQFMAFLEGIIFYNMMGFNLQDTDAMSIIDDYIEKMLS